MADAAPSSLTLYVGPSRGGCYDRLRRLVAALLARGWTVHYVGTEAPLEGRAGLRFHPIEGPAGVASPGVLLGACRRAARVARRERVPLVWTFGAAYTAPLAPLLWRSGARVVTFLRGSLREQERARGSGLLRRALAGLAERRAVAASHRVVAVSRALAARAGKRGEVLPNEAPAAAAPDREAARRELGLPAGAFIAGYAGAMAPIKSLETLIEAAQQVPAAHVALMGFSAAGSPYEDALRARAAALDGRAHLLPWRNGAQSLVAASDVVVLPSRDEGGPNLLLEAIGAGRPALGARCAGIEEVLAWEPLLFALGDAVGLAGRLARLAADPAERAHLASLAQARAAEYRFDWDARAVDVLERALADGPP